MFFSCSEPPSSSTNAGCAVAAYPSKKPLGSKQMAGAAQMAAMSLPAMKCFLSTASNLMWSAMRSAPGMPPGTAIKSQSFGAFRPETSLTLTSATSLTPLEHTTSRRPSSSTEHTTTSAPARRRTSMTVTASISSVPSATGTRTFFLGAPSVAAAFTAGDETAA